MKGDKNFRNHPGIGHPGNDAFASRVTKRRDKKKRAKAQAKKNRRK